MMFSAAVMSLVPFALVSATAATPEVPKSQSYRRRLLIGRRRVARGQVIRDKFIGGHTRSADRFARTDHRRHRRSLNRQSRRQVPGVSSAT
jgi:hypothetical protein